MYFIKKYADCWAIHNDDNGASRPLTADEKELALKEFPQLSEERVCTVFTDEAASIIQKP